MLGYNVIYDILQIMEAFIRAYCFYRLVKPFIISEVMPDSMYVQESIEGAAVKKKKYVMCVGVVYFLTMLVLYTIPFYMNAYVAYEIGSLVMFLFVCWIDRRNYRQKAFLVTVFFALNWIFSAMAEILYDHLYAFAEKTDYMQKQLDEPLWIALYALVCVFYLTLEFAFMSLGIWQVLKVYRNKSADIPNKELVMMIFPSLTGIMSYQIIYNYRRLNFVENGELRKADDILIMLLHVASVISIIVVIVLYQDIKAKKEEELQNEMLFTQLESIRRHIGQVENLYQDIRSMKHDMTNHILTLESLYAENETKAAEKYVKDMKTAIIEVVGEVQSGNPVTDVILREWKSEAEKKNICFQCHFHYPEGSGINVFDVSVMLNNALQNAVENAGGCVAPHISILSYRKNNAYMIEIRNSFAGNLQWDAESGLPITSKGKTDSHGYGLNNIRKIAGKYFGDIDFAFKNEEFILSIMLMLE